MHVHTRLRTHIHTNTFLKLLTHTYAHTYEQIPQIAPIAAPIPSCSLAPPLPADGAGRAAVCVCNSLFIVRRPQHEGSNTFRSPGSPKTSHRSQSAQQAAWWRTTNGILQGCQLSVVLTTVV